MGEHPAETAWRRGTVTRADFDFEGFRCIVKSHDFGHLTGYVGVKRGHPWYGKSTQRVDRSIDVHGGVTYADNWRGVPRRRTRLWWVGFDTAHAWDKPNPELMEPSWRAYLEEHALSFWRDPGAHAWTIEEAVAETRLLAAQAWRALRPVVAVSRRRARPRTVPCRSHPHPSL